MIKGLSLDFMFHLKAPWSTVEGSLVYLVDVLGVGDTM